MILKKLARKIIIIICCLININSKSSDSFLESFIDKYDLESKYTREYHPYTLKKTAESFLQLRKFIADNNIKLEEDIIILGYQEEGIPPYSSQWDRQDIHDEAIQKNNSGSEKSARNMFGFLTGFLFKDSSWLEHRWFPSQQPKFEHICAKQINFFDDNAVVFQKHALGKDFNFIIEFRNELEKRIYSQNSNSVLDWLVKFWKFIYRKSCKSGFGSNIATQDILFSIAYGHMLVEAKCNINKFFIGPDITYPIETLSFQKEEATINAQKFITTLCDYIKPIEDKNTAYIFGSFVDGVGKSTLLNNIQNWQKYNNNFDKYDRCDNSSSQEATLYQLKDKIFIVDLPAQVSHFTIKPEGFVYADILSQKNINKNNIENILDYIKNNKENLINNFEQLKDKVSSENKALYESDNIEYNFAQQVINLKKSQNWVPFEFNNEHYLFNTQDLKDIKILVPLSNTHSVGLKNADAEQMLFFKGLSLPLSYNLFMQKLIDKLKSNNIEKVVFVNFLSMYPRTSRENIRVNFVLQYAKKLFKDKFDIENSFYKLMVHKEPEIYKLLNDKKDKVTENLLIEAALRYSMYNILERHAGQNLNLVSGKILETELEQEVKEV